MLRNPYSGGGKAIEILAREAYIKSFQFCHCDEICVWGWDINNIVVSLEISSFSTSSNLFIYQFRVEFSGKSNVIVFNAVYPVSFMQIRLKTHFYNQIFLPLSGNLSGQNKVPYQILAYNIEKLPI